MMPVWTPTLVRHCPYRGCSWTRVDLPSDTPASVDDALGSHLDEMHRGWTLDELRGESAAYASRSTCCATTRDVSCQRPAGHSGQHLNVGGNDACSWRFEWDAAVDAPHGRYDADRRIDG
jgi:hypothetical protein